MSMQDPWNAPLEQLAEHAWRLATSQTQTDALTAILHARIALKVAHDQQELARALNESADRTAAATRDLVRATNWVAIFTVLAALFAAAAVVVAIVDF